MRIFKGLDLVEQLGSGIPRILESYDKDRFKFSKNFLRVVLPLGEVIIEKKMVGRRVGRKSKNDIKISSKES